MSMHTPTRLGTHIHARTRRHTHTDQYVILIAFSQQQCFRERASMLRYTYIACHYTLHCHDTNTHIQSNTNTDIQTNTNIDI